MEASSGSKGRFHCSCESRMAWDQTVTWLEGTDRGRHARRSSTISPSAPVQNWPPQRGTHGQNSRTPVLPIQRSPHRTPDQGPEPRAPAPSLPATAGERQPLDLDPATAAERRPLHSRRRPASASLSTSRTADWTPWPADQPPPNPEPASPAGRAGGLVMHAKSDGS